jgi:NTP pyrophosphatase (non-canonical NTP hydrolase)
MSNPVDLVNEQARRTESNQDVTAKARELLLRPDVTALGPRIVDALHLLADPEGKTEIPFMEALGRGLDLAAQLQGREATNSGFRDGLMREDPRHCLSLMALLHTEVSEMSEAVRHIETKMSIKLPGETEEAEEAADVLLRLLDYCEFRGIPLGRVFVKKVLYNRTRLTRHGKRV